MGDAAAIISSSAGPADTIVLNNKLAAAASFTTSVDTTPEINAYSNASAFATAKAWLAPVVDPATLATAEASIDSTLASIVSGGSTSGGSTFTLTTAIDNIVGTGANDTIIAGVDGSGNQTLNPGDSVNGGAGTDTMNLFGNGNATAFATANIQAVENVSAQLAGGALDVSANAGVKQAGIAANSTAANTVTLTKAQTGSVQGIAGNFATFDFKDASAPSTADTASLALNGASLTGVVQVFLSPI